MNDKIEKFAEEMSELLYDMRADDLSGNFLITPNTNVRIPDEFVDKTTDEQEHITKMKSLIKNNIINHLTECPDDYKNEMGEYHYTCDVYDFGYAMDTYVEQLYEDKHCTKTVLVCPECGSDNVRVKMWVNANTNEVYDDAMEDDDEYYCNDCKQHVDKASEEIMIPRKKVIGFQVEGHDGVGHHIMHPDMDASFCIYSLSQANEMILNTTHQTGGYDDWKLLTIWTDDIEEPTMMFEGDPRD